MPITAPGVGAPRTPVRPITTPPASAPSVIGARPFAAAGDAHAGPGSAPIAAQPQSLVTPQSMMTPPGMMTPQNMATPPGMMTPPGMVTPQSMATPQSGPRPITTPPPVARPVTAPPSSRARAQAVVVDDPSLSLPIAARRPWGLILVVLLLDAGLAVAGVLLLREGLADRPGRAVPAQRAASPAGST